MRWKVVVGQRSYPPNPIQYMVHLTLDKVLTFWRAIVLLCVLMGVIWLPRGLALDRVVTPDEPTWLTNSANFYRALAHADFSQTYQIEHPGVTTMWIGTTGFLWRYPAYADDSPRQFEWWRETADSFLQARGHPPLALLVTGRVFMVMAITLVLMIAFWSAIRLIGFWPALVGFLLIATDPFHIAHSRLLHLDGLLSSLMLLSLLAFVNYLYKGGRRLDLLVSAVAAGLAWLTKSPALFLIPFAGLLVLFELGTRWRSRRKLARRDWQWAVYTLILWGTVGLVVFVLLWPAMWVDPLYTLWRVMRATVSYAAEGHQEAATYFNGVIVDGDPGLHFYPLTYLWRTTPVVLVGLGLTAAAYTLSQAASIRPTSRRTVAMMLLFALSFTLFMSLGAKKFDRYLLPIFAPLDLVAGIGWVAGARWLLLKHHWQARAVAIATFLLVVAGQAGSAAQAFPYYLSYYNPLLGGTTAAPAVMMVGWGEGLDQAARYLNDRPGAEELQVAVGVWNGTFSYFFDGNLQWSTFDPESSHVEEWTTSDYLVIYINQWQRGRLPQELLDYLANLTPAMVVRLQGLDYAYIYDIRAVPAPGYLLSRPGAEAGEQGSRGAEEHFSSSRWRRTREVS